MRPFRGHFARQRNIGVDLMTTDWILEIDADEKPSGPFLAGLREISNEMEKSGVDCAGIARLNFLDGVLVDGPGSRGLDYQYRLHHRCGCRWRGVVHEELTGYRARVELAVEDGHFLVHDKESPRHEARNTYYDTLEAR